jgi:hypothetical protein
MFWVLKWNKGETLLINDFNKYKYSILIQLEKEANLLFIEKECKVREKILSLEMHQYNTLFIFFVKKINPCYAMLCRARA